MNWPRPNYKDPITQAPALLVVQLVFLVTALASLGLRLYARKIRMCRTWWDDWLMVSATVFSVALAVSLTVATKSYSWNLHIWDVPPSMITAGRQISLIAQTFFLLSTGLSKLAILCSYLRIAPSGSHLKRASWLTIALVILLTCVFIIILWNQCRPIWHYWSLDENKCTPELPHLVANGITTIATDLAVYLLPMPTLLRLNMPLTQRIQLAFLFGVGLLVIIADILRVYWSLHVEMKLQEDPSYDTLWNSYNIWVWAAIEADLAIICGCAPAVRSLIKKKDDGRADHPQAIGFPKTGDQMLGTGQVHESASVDEALGERL